MIAGTVSDDGREARIDIRVRGFSSPERSVSAVVDTGFTGALSLPASLVQELALPYLIQQRAALANGAEIVVAVPEAVLLWDGKPRHVRVLATGDAALVGTRLLNSYALTVEMRSGGAVRIEPLSTS